MLFVVNYCLSTWTIACFGLENAGSNSRTQKGGKSNTNIAKESRISKWDRGVGLVTGAGGSAGLSLARQGFPAGPCFCAPVQV
jgi:hypothetical protein